MDSMEKLQIPRSRFIIQMPTGSENKDKYGGNLNLFENADEGTIVFWLAHSSELCEQAFQCFIEVWQYV